MNRYINLMMFLVLIILINSSTSSLANDGSAGAEPAGQIKFINNEHVRMLEEILEISAVSSDTDTYSIKVFYRFINESSNDITTLVAFPMPAYSNWTDIYARNPQLEGPIKRFTVFVDGVAIPFKKEIKVTSHSGEDITEVLRKGLGEKEMLRVRGYVQGEEPIGENKTGDEFTAEQIDFLNAQKFASGGLGWDIQETLYWETTFPAQKEITVEHSYSPKYGREPFGYELTSELFKNGEITKTDEFGYILGDIAKVFSERKKKIDDRERETRYKFTWGSEDIVYILGTAKTWKGAIKKFTLRIITKDPSQIVMLDFPGKPIKVNDTTYEFHHTDFVPPEALYVRFFNNYLTERVNK